jgi:hypothetical protein
MRGMRAQPHLVSFVITFRKIMVLACRRCCRLHHTILLDDAPHLFTCLSCLLLTAETASITFVTYTFLIMAEEAPMGLGPTKGTVMGLGLSFERALVEGRQRQKEEGYVIGELGTMGHPLEQ